MIITKVLKLITSLLLFFLFINIVVYAKPFLMMINKEHYKSIELEVMVINNKIRIFFN